MKKLAYGVLALLALAIGTTFAMQNAQPAVLSYYFGVHWETPLSVMLIATFAGGAVAGLLASLGVIVRLQRQLVQARKDVRGVEQELVNLRSLPIRDVL